MQPPGRCATQPAQHRGGQCPPDRSKCDGASRTSDHMYTLRPGWSSSSQWEVLGAHREDGIPVTSTAAGSLDRRGHRVPAECSARLNSSARDRRVVIKATVSPKQLESGRRALAPRGDRVQVRAEEAETDVEEIACYVGRTGVLTPVAHVKPVVVGGVTIRNITMHTRRRSRERRVRRSARRDPSGRRRHSRDVSVKEPKPDGRCLQMPGVRRRCGREGRTSRTAASTLLRRAADSSGCATSPSRGALTSKDLGYATVGRYRSRPRC